MKQAIHMAVIMVRSKIVWDADAALAANHPVHLPDRNPIPIYWFQTNAKPARSRVANL